MREPVRHHTGTRGKFKQLYNPQGPCLELWSQSRTSSDIVEVRIMAVRIGERLLYNKYFQTTSILRDLSY